MIELEKAEVWGFEHAIRGMRNPLESWDKGDSVVGWISGHFTFGENDENLAQRLIKAGTDHRKFMRQIMVSVDITAPLYWWKEFDTYKVGTTANSTSTMHKIMSKRFEPSMFSLEDTELEEKIYNKNIASHICFILNLYRDRYLETRDKTVWRALIQLLPSSWNQTRTVTMSYENLMNMYSARWNHKLTEWKEYCEWIKSLPYAYELIIMEEDK